MSGKLRILVIGAHPADIFDQSGGTMAHHVKRGDWVGALILTHGARIHDEVVSSQLYTSRDIPQGKALDALSSQSYSGAFARKRIESSDGGVGQCVNCSYAEPFTRLYPENHRYLPVTEHAMDLLPLSDKEVLKLRSMKIPPS